MKSAWLSLLGLLISTVLLVWLWQMAGKFRLPTTGIDSLLKRLRHQTWIASAETIKNEESEEQFKLLKIDCSGKEILCLRLYVVALYVLVVFIILGR